MIRSNASDLVQERTEINKAAAATSKNKSDNESGDCDKRNNDVSHKDLKLTLMEEVFLLGLKDCEGHTSFWNLLISTGLRGCILVELALRGRIQLEKQQARRRSLLQRKVQWNNEAPTGDVILDEVLNHVRKSGIEEGVQGWIDILSGDHWNPCISLDLQLLDVRKRIAENLVEKGVLTTGKQNFVLFDMTTHPLFDKSIKTRMIKRIQDAVILKWPNDVSKMDKRTLALIYLAQASNVLGNAFQPLSDDDYDVATSHASHLFNLDFEEQAVREGSNEVLWAVIANFQHLFMSWLRRPTSCLF